MQALRLLNRAIDSLSRLNQTSTISQEEDEDPFAVSNLKEALPLDEGPSSKNTKGVTSTTSSIDNLEWRIGDCLLHTMFTISRVYFKRGSVREAEYFAQQAQALAMSLKVPAAASRAMAYKGEVQILLGKLQDAQDTLSNAVALEHDITGADSAHMRRLQGDTYLMAELNDDAQAMYLEAIRILGDAGSALLNAEMKE